MSLSHCDIGFVHPQFWDTRSPNPMMSLQMPERCYCADVVSRGNFPEEVMTS